jgi:hypothetical protein
LLVPVCIGTATALICASMRKHATHVNQSNIRRFTEDSPFVVTLEERPIFSEGLRRELKADPGRAARRRGYGQL